MLLEEITPQNIAIKIAAQVPMDIEIPPSNKMNYFYILTLLNVLLLINLNITQVRCYKTKQNPYLKQEALELGF
ncbi:CBS domain containing-hemolysin-like protein [Bacillus mycoides]